MSNSSLVQPWSIAIFAARETLATLMITVDAVINAIRRPSTVNILINGNLALAEELSQAFKKRSISNPLVCINVWWIELGDKAHAWNQYVQYIWGDGQLAYFIDGYARPHPSALLLLEESVCFCSHVFASTGLPSSGRSVKTLGRQLLETHGIHGNLYCVKPSVMSHIRETGFHLPLGIYRTDSTLEAAIKFSFDPKNNSWDLKRVFVHPEVTWSVPKKYWWKYSDIKGQFKRFLRQAQGNFENKAIQFHLQFCKRKPETLPITALEAVETWITARPNESDVLLRKPLHRRALENMRKSAIVNIPNATPALYYESDRCRNLPNNRLTNI